MSSKSKRKGNTYESELVKQFEIDGLKAVRAWGSNGKSLGESEEVDVILTDNRNRRWRIQAKRRAGLPKYLQVNDGVELVFAREDRGESLVIMRYSKFVELLKGDEDALLS
jgi:Holliday junction resolvase